MQSQISPSVEACLDLLAAANEAVISAERAISETTIATGSPELDALFEANATLGTRLAAVNRPPVALDALRKEWAQAFENKAFAFEFKHLSDKTLALLETLKYPA